MSTSYDEGVRAEVAGEVARDPATPILPPSAPSSPRVSRRLGRTAAAARRWVSPVALILLWQLLSSAGVIPAQTMASPATIAHTAGHLIADGTLLSATLVSLKRVLLGFLVGGVLGVTLALVAGLSRVGEDLVDPPLQMLRTLPHFGLIPLFIVWMGIGESPKIALIALGVAFPLYLNTFAGIRGIDPKLLEAARVFGLSRGQQIRRVVVPGAVPQALTGLRLSLGVAWLSLIVAETVSANAGLGYLINNAREFLQTDVIVVGLAVYALLGLATDALVRALERRALVWRS